MVTGGALGHTSSMTAGGITTATSQSEAVLAVKVTSYTTPHAAITMTAATQKKASRVRSSLNMPLRYSPLPESLVHN